MIDEQRYSLFFTGFSAAAFAAARGGIGGLDYGGIGRRAKNAGKGASGVGASVLEICIGLGAAR